MDTNERNTANNECWNCVNILYGPHNYVLCKERRINHKCTKTQSNTFYW